MKKVLFFLFIFLLAGYNRQTLTSKTGFYMGTVVTIKIYDNANEDVFNKCFEKLKKLEDELSINKEGTEVISSQKMQMNLLKFQM